MAHPKRATDSLTEKQWMRQVVDLAKTLGWSTYHPYLSIYSAKGWPDLALWRERLILAELKTSNGRLSPSQVERLSQVSKLLALRSTSGGPSTWTKSWLC
ncbi:MAG: hypothetical protein IT209_00620 [Armatimonadetes bacterium]|nr:hypothetical protein [Armatimonadota bacterium]